MRAPASLVPFTVVLGVLRRSPNAHFEQSSNWQRFVTRYRDLLNKLS